MQNSNDSNSVAFVVIFLILFFIDDYFNYETFCKSNTFLPKPTKK